MKEETQVIVGDLAVAHLGHPEDMVVLGRLEDMVVLEHPEGLGHLEHQEVVIQTCGLEPVALDICIQMTDT